MCVCFLEVLIGLIFLDIKWAIEGSNLGILGVNSIILLVTFLDRTFVLYVITSSFGPFCVYLLSYYL